MKSSRNKIEIDKQRLIDRFLYWAKVNAPSKEEKKIANLLSDELKRLGFSVKFDSAHDYFGGECGNLIAYWEGTDSSIEPMFLSTHMDTVLPTKDLNPIIKDGTIHSDGTTILGADDRAALASYLEAIEYIQENNIPCGPIELILTVSEQQALIGARYLDYTKVKSKYGYIFDNHNDVGYIITQGPYSSKFYITINGISAHLASNPEGGVNALLIAADIIKNTTSGRVNDRTVSNIGLIKGGELTSIIPPRIQLIGEVRSESKEELDKEIENILSNAVKIAKNHGGTINKKVDKKYLGFNIDSNHKLVKNAINATESIKVKPNVIKTLGGADTNVFNEKGLECITLANGFRDIHSFKEHISIESLINTGNLVISLIKSWYESHK